MALVNLAPMVVPRLNVEGLRTHEYPGLKAGSQGSLDRPKRATTVEALGFNGRSLYQAELSLDRAFQEEPFISHEVLYAEKRAT
jgi:hypothetical protein